MPTNTTAPAGGRRFWIVVLCFAIANAGVWVGYDRWQKAHRHHLLEVTQFTPGDGALVEGQPVFRWSFNLDVVPPAAKAPAVARITPAVAGKWEWPDARTLTFVPDAPLPRATPIRLTLDSDALHSADGFRLQQPYVTSLKTAPLSVVSSHQVLFDDGDRVVIELAFNDKVNPADMIKHLSLRGSDGSEVHFHPHGEVTGKKVRVITDPVTRLFGRKGSPAIDLTVSKGLAGEAGPLGLEGDYSDRLTIAQELLATETEAFFPSHDEPFIQVRFNNPIDVEVLKQVMSVTPPVAFTMSSGYQGVDLHGAFQPGTRYVVKLGPPPAGVAGRSAPRPTTLSALIPDREPGVWFESGVGYLSADGNRTVLAHVVNMTDLRATVTRVYDNNLVAWRNAGRHGYWREIESFSRPVAVRDIHLPGQKNQKQDVRLSLDDLLPAGEARDGVYQISLRMTSPTAGPARWSNFDDDSDDDSSDFGYRYGGASTMVTLSDIGLTAKQGRDGVTVWATSLRTAKPLPGIHVRLFSNKNQLLGEGATEKTGLATIVPLPAGPGEKISVVIADQVPTADVRDDGDAAASGEARKASARERARAIGGRGLTWLDLRDSSVPLGDADIAGRPYLRHGYEAFVYTDRGVYRPGEMVHLRAIVRGPDNVQPQRFPVRWQIRRPDLRDWKAQMSEIDADGASSFDLALPGDLPSGRWTANLGLPGEAGASLRFFGSIAFDVEDFLPQRMKVSVEIGDVAADQHNKQSNRIMLGDDPITAHVQADYLFGRPVAERPATAVVRVDPIPFQPAGYRDWTFGDEANTAEALGHSKPLGRRAELASTDLDAKGHAKWNVDVTSLIEKGEAGESDGSAPKLAGIRHRGHRNGGKNEANSDKIAPADYAGPWRLSITGSVTETGGRAVTASRQIDVDRAPNYVGVRPRETSPRPGVEAIFDVNLITPSGAVADANDSIEYTLLRETWNSSYVYEQPNYRFRSTRILEPIGQGAKSISVQKGKGQIAITPPAFGSYVLLVRDLRTQCVASVGFYAGFGAWEDNISRQNPERLELIVQPLPDGGLTDAVAYAVSHRDPTALLEFARRAAMPPAVDGKLRVGDPAQVIVRSPFAGQLLLAVENDGVISTQVLEMPANHLAVKIDVTGACRPNAYVTATVLRAIHPNAQWSIHRAVGVTRLSVDNSDRKLTVQLAAPAEIRPEHSLGVQLRVLDYAGNPVPNAAVSVAAVDEGICRLTDFQTPDPFSFFMEKRALAVHSYDLFGQLMPEVPKPGKQSGVGGDDNSAFGLRRGSPVGARRVRPVALVSAIVHTNDQGIAKADFPTPQFTGQLRVMAVASADRSFGSSDTPVLVRSPLLVQSSWPRFAAPADRFSVPLTVFNNGPNEGEVKLTVELSDADGPLRFAENKGTKLSLQLFSIPAGGQKTTAFEIIALDRIGVAHARMIATMGDETYEESVELPIRPASPSVTVGGYLTAKPDAPATVEIPAGFIDGTSKLDLRVCSLPQFQMPEGLDYLDRYPHGCVEQTTSTLFPLVYLSDIGQQISPGLFDKARVADKVQVGMLRLMSMQTSDGGLSMWPGGRDDWAWGSVYAAHFLVEAQAAGFDVPDELRDPLVAYVRGLLSKPEESAATIELQAYAAYVTALAGKPQRAVMGRLSEVLKTEDAGSARFHLAAAWLAAGRRDLASGLLPQVILALRNDRDLGGNVGSGIRDRAILLSTLLAVDPEDPRIAGLVQQLADSGRAKQWRSTQDTAFAVLAIGRYLRHAKTKVPYETAELLLDGERIAFAERGKPLVWTAASLDEQMTHDRAPGAAKLPAAGAKLEIRVTGPAGATAHVGWMQSGVQIKPPASADNGLVIRRRYLDEHGKPLTAMRVQSGDLVQVELTVQSNDAFENLVIEDLLPAGLEIENPRLAGNAAGVAVRPKQRNRANESEPTPIFSAIRSDMRDDRLILVGHQTAAGSGIYLYTARAMTPGKFVLPPVKGECMYDSAVNSLWGAGTFEVMPANGAKVAGGWRVNVSFSLSPVLRGGSGEGPCGEWRRYPIRPSPCPDEKAGFSTEF